MNEDKDNFIDKKLAEFDKKFKKDLQYFRHTGLLMTELDIKSFLRSALLEQERKTFEEEHQFFLNILDGIDIADRESRTLGKPIYGGTDAIRFALKSRVLNTTKHE